MIPRILITGATGALGPRIVNAFIHGGFSVSTFSIDPPQIGDFPSQVKIHIGDIVDRDAVRTAMDNIDIVIHLASLLHIDNPPYQDRKNMERVNVEGALNVTRAALLANVRRVVFFSTIAVYGDTQGKIVDENSPPCPNTLYGQTKLEAERLILKAARSDRYPLGTVLRLGAAYGSRVKGNYARLLRALARGRFLPVGDGLNRRTLIYDQDVAQAAVLAAEHPKASGRIFNVTDGSFHSIQQIIEAICLALGRKPPRYSPPAAPVRFIAAFAEDTAKLLRMRPLIRRDMIDKYMEDVAVDSSRIRQELGFVPSYDLISGWKETVQEMRRSGDLK